MATYSVRIRGNDWRCGPLPREFTFDSNSRSLLSFGAQSVDNRKVKFSVLAHDFALLSKAAMRWKQPRTSDKSVSFKLLDNTKSTVVVKKECAIPYAHYHSLSLFSCIHVYIFTIL